MSSERTASANVGAGPINPQGEERRGKRANCAQDVGNAQGQECRRRVAVGGRYFANNNKGMMAMALRQHEGNGPGHSDDSGGARSAAVAPRESLGRRFGGNRKRRGVECGLGTGRTGPAPHCQSYRYRQVGRQNATLAGAITMGSQAFAGEEQRVRPHLRGSDWVAALSDHFPRLA